MKKQTFKMIAQNSIDEIEEQIDDLNHFIQKAPVKIKSDFHKIAEELNNDKNSLIAQYDNLNSIAEEKWDDAIISFKTTRDILKDKIDTFLTKK